MRNLLALMAILVLPAMAWAQDPPKRMETDRPDQTETPFIVARGYFQGEMGFNYERYKNDINSWVHPTLLSKYGLSKRFEFRLITELETITYQGIAGTRKNTGLRPIQVGGKIGLFEEKGLLPKTGLIFHLTVPKAASPEFQQTKWAPNFRFVMQNRISRTINLGYNLGAEWDGESNKPTWIYTIAPSIDIGERWYAYIEWFGFLNDDNHPQHSFDGGIAYYVNSDLKLDLSGGFGLTPNTNLKYYTALGLSFRFR